MMQALLADRFHLQIHRLSKPLPAYNLVVSKGGPTLKETAGGTVRHQHSPDTRSGQGVAGSHHCDQRHNSEQILHGHLGRDTGRPTFDKTGLTGHYDFTPGIYTGPNWPRCRRIDLAVPRIRPSRSARPQTGINNSALRHDRNRSRRKAFRELSLKEDARWDAEPIYVTIRLTINYGRWALLPHVHVDTPPQSAFQTRHG